MRKNNLKAMIVGLGLSAISGLASAGVISTSMVSPVTTAGFGLVAFNQFNSIAANSFWTTNQGLMVSPSNGWLGALSITGGGLVSYSYLGKEAGFSNHFFNASGTNTPIDDTEAFGTTSFQLYGSSIAQLLQFSFTSTGNGAVANGTTAGTPQFAIFSGSCATCGTSSSALTTGYQYILAYNDKGGDHDWDDMLIGIRTRNPGDGGVDPDPVPEPASLALLGLGLAGLGFIRRRKAV